MKVKIFVQDEINCYFTGVSQTHMDTLYDMYGLHTENYFHSLHYKLGTWDGKKRLIHQTGQTYVYLLPTIIKHLNKWNYTFELFDNRRQINLPTNLQVDPDLFAHINNEYGDPFTMRDYQIQAINSVFETHGGIIEAGTGAGKTLLSGAITKTYENFGLRCITIVPTATLVKQSADQFKEWEIDCGRFDGKVKELGHTHLVTTWQSLKNVPIMLSEYDVIIIDECQAAKASVLSNLIVEHGKNAVVRIGMTGTMPKHQLDNLLVRIALGSIRYIIPADVLINEGYLSTIQITIKELKETFNEDYFPDYSSEMKYLRQNSQRNGWVADFVLNLSQQEKGNVLMLVSSKPHGKKFARDLKKIYSNVHFVSGDISVTEDRKKIYDLFKTQNNLIVVATAQVAGVGLSIDRIFNLVLLDIGKSFIRVIQAIGRGLRKNDKAGKDHCEIFDIGSNLKYSKIHGRKRVKYYKENNYPFGKEIVEYKFDVDFDSEIFEE